MPAELELLKLRLTCISLHGLIAIHGARDTLIGGDPLLEASRILGRIYEDVGGYIPQSSQYYTSEEFAEYLRDRLREAEGKYTVALSQAEGDV